ncbi:SDR family NAD(P)-dependent oxidoreductase [Frankia sp. CNm7]|uniref:SDR family NAD(P)-dependent oxidoreductase n=1 Tax=Frankia nepalensis TaxID=1836974 RepID=A0A937UT23_9ACTN|nr:SDR family NAD(P)-dependent oxidoreductase [Frankia nepalensis]MBL7499087.1 SDR family NAD(P)-dependent oxidoreductase [Frankia nepalensis]MBL7511433.1 SDR family NAD(P)-dependent oxidoreductase [Frankia nepalensis]MBL7517052.1 SDR family NAD(P)-dependent oxidoreductase [Frankia nepalensis]MBL7629536.1 SDR family NAD(P)-dependent oxidoreductase [Frankia nepalensis]
MNLTAASAIVTGGAGGLGAATVRHLVGLGVGVVIFDLDGERAKSLAAELGPTTTAVSGDVTVDADVASAIDAARELGTLSIVANVAGGGTRPARTVGRDGAPHDLATFVGTLAKNTVGTFNVTRLAAAAMAANTPDEDGQRGVVVNTGSLAGLEGQAGQVAYAAAKAAILGMTLPLARDLAPLGIRVCGIAPGTIGTDLMLSASQQLKDKLVATIVFPHRMGRPAEFALLVEAIIRNPYLNGENIRLDAAQRFPAK